MKKIVKFFFRAFGLEVHKAGAALSQVTNQTFSQDSMAVGLRRMKANGIIPASVIDLGAAQGSWSLLAFKTWSEAEYVLFEPLEERWDELKSLAASTKNFRIVHAAAGNRVGQTSFVVSDDLDGSGVYDSDKDDGSRQVELTTIDYVVATQKLKGPFLVKFDTHGFELPILEGATLTLKETELVVMECYGFEISKDCLRLGQMCQHMEKLGFRLADIVDIMRRPGDNLFWQCDAFFIPATHPFFKSNSYS